MKLIIFLFFLLTLVNGNDFKKLDRLVLSGPMANVTHPLLYIIETNALQDVAKNVEFKLWKNPDELRALTLRNNVDFVAVPSNVAANLYNKKVNIKLLNISTWSILNMITRDKSLKTLADFKGKEIAMPFRADMPDIVFEEIVKAQGFDPKKDFKLQYLSTPIDAMQMLILRRVDHALLAEPATSIALRKTGSFPLKLIAPDLYRSAILANEWAKTFNIEAKIPVAGMAVVGDIANNSYLVKRFNEEYKKAVTWYKNNPKQAGELAEKYIKMLDAKGVEDSIGYVKMDVVTSTDAKKDLEFFLEILKKNNPKSIGGEVPDVKFYY